MELEPLVHEEQGVVYLFGRYWEQIKKRGKNKDKLAIVSAIQSVNTRFPDCTYYTKDGKTGRIEFKYKKSDFLKCYRNRLDDLSNPGGYNDYDRHLPFLVIFWLDDCVLTKPNKKKIKKHKIRFINLSDEFDHTINKETSALISFLMFGKNRKRAPYNYKQIESHLKKVGIKDKELLKKIDKSYIRVLGHDAKDGAGNAEIEHWKNIHMYTTRGKNKFLKGKIPIRIFFVPKDRKDVVAYITPKYRFWVTNNFKGKLKSFYHKFYMFEPYPDDEEGHCIIYDKFKFVENGRQLFRELKKKVKGTGRNGWAVYDNTDLFKKLIDA